MARLAGVAGVGAVWFVKAVSEPSLPAVPVALDREGSPEAAMNYYNEIDPFAAQWLRKLIEAGLIPQGDVDDRSIVDVRGDDLRGYEQCHFFAGIGGWPYALELAGWEGECWTGSCPCQPFSVAGAGKGTADERHLWPAFRRLIEECGPPVVFGEQVASEAGRTWLTGVRADLEELGYACGAADLCAAGVTAPHIRQRLYWVAESEGVELRRPAQTRNHSGEVRITRTDAGTPSGRGRSTHGLADHDHDGPYRTRGVATIAGGDEQDGRVHRGSPGGLERLVYPARSGSQAERLKRALGGGDAYRSGPWLDFTVIECGDGKYRRIPVEPEFQFMADGLSSIMGSGWDAFCARIEKEVADYGRQTDTSPGEALRAVWNIVGADANERASRRQVSVHASPFLFAALCQLARPLGGIPQDDAQGVAESSRREMHGLRRSAEESPPSARTPHRRELAGQLTVELSDRLFQMSHEEASRDGSRGALELLTRFPLSSASVPGTRVGLLRGAGNAIVPPLAAEFVQAFMEIDAR